MQDIYQTFEFNKILDEIASLTKTERGKELVLSLSFQTERNKIQEDLDELNEMMTFIYRYSNLPIEASKYLLKIIEMGKKTAILTPNDFYFILSDIVTSNKILEVFKKYEENFPLLKARVDHFVDLSSLEKEIKRIITPSLTLSDNATPELKEIRRDIKNLEANLHSKLGSIVYKYSEYLSDSNLTIRDGHFVLPVKTSYKNKILGLVYDVSDSGNTTFIEPLEIVQLNNDIASKKALENEEIRKILKGLTALVLLQEDEVINNNEIIGYLDFLTAKARYALNEEMVIATLSEEQEVMLEQARHPLINKKKVVRNDYVLSKDKRIVIISGPNAGGKTVSIKTVGLLTLMNQVGLAVPASKARLGIFNHIYIDIGDNQSLSDNLSTFSAHMKNIGEILDTVKGKDLVLIDELGTGTDPKEGEVLSIGIVKYLEKKQPLCLISSHYSKLKEYAYISENIENSSMLFDEEKLQPTYIYKHSAPGKSYGIEVATRYGIKSEIIEDAKSQLDKSGDSFEAIIDKLNKQVIENERMKDELVRQSKIIESEKKSLESAQKAVKNQKEHLLEEVKNEKEQILRETEEEIDEIMKSLDKDNVKLHEVIEAKKRLKNLEDQEVEIIYDEVIRENDYVSIPSLGLEGKVKRINGKKCLISSSDGLDFEVDMEKLHKVEAPKESKTKTNKANYEYKINTNVGLELNIIGMRRDEAKEALIKYLDNVQLKNIKTVRIIHGFGSGILRKMVHEYLSTLKGVTFRLGDINEGGGGATVVSFK